MTTRGLSHINFHGDRPMLDALKDFYCGVVGLEVGDRPNFPLGGYWLYAGGEPIVHLYECAPGEVRDNAAQNSFDHVAFDCANIDAVEALLKRNGVKYRRADVPGRKTVQLFLHDPAGNSVEMNFAAG